MADHETVPAPATRPATPVIDRLKATGNWNPNWDPFADLDPEWTERFMTMGMTPIARGVLDPKTLSEWVLADRLPVRVQLQAHKYIWGADVRGV